MEALLVDLHDQTLHIYEYHVDSLHPTIEEALRSNNASAWKNAMCLEIKALKKNGTWTLVPPPEGKNFITCKWILTMKCDANGNLTRFKA